MIRKNELLSIGQKKGRLPMTLLTGLPPSQAISLIKALKMSITTALIQINQEAFEKKNKRQGIKSLSLIQYL